MGPLVTPWDLVFAICFLVTVGVLLAAIVQALRGRGAKALRMLGGWALGAALYLAVLMAVSLRTPQRVLDLGEDRCFDDWCITAERADWARSAHGETVTVGLRVWSRAKRVDQRGPGSEVFLIDQSGRRWDPVPDPVATPLSVMLHAGEAVETSRAFEVPPDARELGLVVNHGEGPGNFVIGDEASWLHKRTIYRIEPAPEAR